MSRPPLLVLPTPFGRAFARLADHVMRGLVKEGISPDQSDGEPLVDMCYQQMGPAHATGEGFQRLAQSYDFTLGWERRVVKYTQRFNALVGSILSLILFPQPVGISDRTEVTKALYPTFWLWYRNPSAPVCHHRRAIWHAWQVTPVLVPVPTAPLETLQCQG